MATLWCNTIEACNQMVGSLLHELFGEATKEALSNNTYSVKSRGTKFAKFAQNGAKCQQDLLPQSHCAFPSCKEQAWQVPDENGATEKKLARELGRQNER